MVTKLIKATDEQTLYSITQKINNQFQGILAQSKIILFDLTGSLHTYAAKST